jgi:hypothetical protein
MAGHGKEISNVTVSCAAVGSWDQFRLVPTDTKGHYAIQTVSKGLDSRHKALLHSQAVDTRSGLHDE